VIRQSSQAQRRRPGRQPRSAAPAEALAAEA